MKTKISVALSRSTESVEVLSKCQQPSVIFTLYLLLTFYFLTLQTFNCFSQGTAINTTGSAADASSILDITSTDKGLLVPRMTTVQRNAIASPDIGLLIYNTDCNEFQYYTSSTWISMISGNSIIAPVASAATNMQTTSLSANWNSVTGATVYYLDASTASDFSSFVTGYNNLNVGNVLTYSVTGLTCNTAYYYRVRAGSACGAGINSNIITASTAACFTCGSPFTDVRDGKSYNTILIGSQCWMAQNLDYGTYVAISGSAQAAGTKFCQNLSGVNDATCPIGGLYEWANMMNGSASCNGTGAGQPGCTTPVQGLCPVGWHVPSHYEWTLLEKNAGSNPGAFPYDVTTNNVWLGTDEGGNLKETPICGTLPCWFTPNTGATNSSGFAALPGGIEQGGSFYNCGTAGDWWSATENGATFAWNRRLIKNQATVFRFNAFDKVSAFSVRCVKD